MTATDERAQLIAQLKLIDLTCRCRDMTYRASVLLRIADNQVPDITSAIHELDKKHRGDRDFRLAVRRVVKSLANRELEASQPDNEGGRED